MNTLSTWIFTVLLSIVPPQKAVNESEVDMKARYESIATDMAEVIEKSKPIFNGKDAELRTAALLSSIAFYESGLRKDVDEGNARGDSGRSWCLMQINIGNGHVLVGDAEMKSWTGKDLVTDRKKCFAAAIEVVRASMKQCSHLKDGSVLGGYTTGKCIANEKTATSRWNLSQQLIKKYPYIVPEPTQAFLVDIN